jgi:uncharacterized protein YodC (DUF2158 family)
MKPGSIVQLKHGGLRMTVVTHYPAPTMTSTAGACQQVYPEGDKSQTAWFDYGRNLCMGYFPDSALEIIASEKA